MKIFPERSIYVIILSRAIGLALLIGLSD